MSDLYNCVRVFASNGVMMDGAPATQYIHIVSGCGGVGSDDIHSVELTMTC